MEDIPLDKILIHFFIIFILLIIYAWFSITESSIISINENKLDDISNYDRRNKLIKKVLDKPKNFLAMIQFFRTFLGLFMSAYISKNLTLKLSTYLADKNIRFSYNISLVINTILLTYVIIIFGKVIPKQIGIKKSNLISRIVIDLAYLCIIISYPFVFILTGIANFFIKLLRLDKDDEEDKVTKEEIKSLVETGEEHGTINEIEKDMIESIFEFDGKTVEKVMTPRTSVYCININDDLNDYIDEMLSMRFSRIPIYQDEIDNIVGILYIKEFIIEAKDKGFNNIDIKKIMKEPFFIPECKKVQQVFVELQKSKRQMAVVIDEYGGFSGIVTMEDLIEEVMGEIEDEYDIRKDGIKKIDDKLFLVDGVTTLEEINERLNIDIQSEEVDTLSGFIINLLGKLPTEEKDKIIKYKNLIFTIEKMNEKIIEKVLINIK